VSEIVKQLRNIALVAHGGAGKTSLAEVMLYNAGVIKRLGRVEEPEELKRTMSLSTGFHQYNCKKQIVSIIDTPGDQNFFSDTRNCMQAADGVVVVIDAVDGLKVQTEMAWDFAGELNLPCAIFINKLDRERSDFFRTFKDAVDTFEPKPIILQLPIGAESEFKGVVDLIGMKVILKVSQNRLIYHQICKSWLRVNAKHLSKILPRLMMNFSKGILRAKHYLMMILKLP